MLEMTARGLALPAARVAERRSIRVVEWLRSERRNLGLRRAALLTAASLLVAAIFLPLWGLTLWSIQFPKGLRMVVNATQVTGDISNLNTLNHYIGMLPISNDFFPELRVLPLAFGGAALMCVVIAFIRRRWLTVLPVVVLALTAVYGLVSMKRRLHQFGHELDPTAAITIQPFTPPVFGEFRIAQFVTYSYFGTGTTAAVIAGILVAAALYLDYLRRR